MNNFFMIFAISTLSFVSWQGSQLLQLQKDNLSLNTTISKYKQLSVFELNILKNQTTKACASTQTIKCVVQTFYEGAYQMQLDQIQ